MSAAALSSSLTLPAGTVDHRGVGWWGLLCAIASEAVLFAYLLFAWYYGAIERGHDWIPGTLPSFRLSLPNTLILLASSVTAYFAEHSVRRNRRGAALALLAITIVLGAVFLAIQVQEWESKTFTISSGAYGSLYYTLTGFHMAHVAAGLVALLLALVWCARGYFDARRHVPLSIVGAYWHFVDVVWLTLFFTIYIAPRLW